MGSLLFALEVGPQVSVAQMSELFVYGAESLLAPIPQEQGDEDDHRGGSDVWGVVLQNSL